MKAVMAAAVAATHAGEVPRSVGLFAWNDQFTELRGSGKPMMAGTSPAITCI
jgi:hypothetical protein